MATKKKQEQRNNSKLKAFPANRGNFATMKKNVKPTQIYEGNVRNDIPEYNA